MTGAFLLVFFGFVTDGSLDKAIRFFVLYGNSGKIPWGWIPALVDFSGTSKVAETPKNPELPKRETEKGKRKGEKL